MYFVRFFHLEMTIGWLIMTYKYESHHYACDPVEDCIFWQCRCTDHRTYEKMTFDVAHDVS